MIDQASIWGGVGWGLFWKHHCRTVFCILQTAAQPMQNILQRLQVPYIKIILFSDRVILEDPIEEWPLCHCFIAFFSKGFPLDKAIDYVKLRQPLVINDLEMQYSLMDRYTINSPTNM